MAEFKISEDVRKTIDILLYAVKNQPENKSEIFQLICQLPIITNTFPAKDSNHSIGEDDELGTAQLNQLLYELEKWCVEQLKYSLNGIHSDGSNDCYQGKIAKVCYYIESLNIIGGESLAKEKFLNVLSHKSDVILQNNMEYIAEVSKNISQIEANFSALVKDTKELALDAIVILFLVEGLNMSYEEQINYIADPILEKLSVELLTLVDSLKESIFRQMSPSTARSSIGSSSHINLFTALTATIGEDTCFNSQELFSLANIIGLFLDLEMSLQKSEYTLLLQAKFKDERARKSALKQRSQLPDLLRSSQESSWVRSSQIFGSWNWQEILKDIGPVIVRSIAKVFDDCRNNEENSARNFYHIDNLCSVLTVQSASSSLLTGPGIPCKVISCYGQILKLMKTLLPYAILGSQYKPLSGLCTCYVDESSLILKSMKSFLMTILNDFPSRVPIKNIYYALSTCEDVCSILTYCASMMEAEPRVPFQGILQLYKDLNKTVKNTIIQSLSSQLSLFTLHDADSHHWSDPKEFNEGEGCSYSILMWNICLKQLWSQLGCCISEVQRNAIFKDVFISSLNVLQARYAKCEPSYNRTKQLTLDIAAILETCKYFLFHFNFHINCTFWGDVPIFLTNVAGTPSKINSSCDALISVLYLVTRPLDIVEKGIVLSSSEEVEKQFCWLHLVNPNTFRETWKGHFSCLSDRGALSHGMALMNTHPSQSLLHCLYILVTKNYFLLDQLLQNQLDLTFEQNYSPTTLESDILKIFITSPSAFDEVVFRIAFKASQEDVTKVTQVLLLENNEIPNAKQPWKHALLSALRKILCQSMLMVGRYIGNISWSSVGSSLISSLPTSMKNLIVNISDSDTDDQRNCELACILMVIQGIEHAIYCLPEWMVIFFTNVNDHVKNAAKFDQKLESPIFHILLSVACQVLRSPELWEECHGIEFRRQGISCMENISDLLLKFLEVTKPLTENALESVVFQHLRSLLEKIPIHFKRKPASHLPEQYIFEECQRMLKNIEINNKMAVESLRRIKKLINKNCRILCGEDVFEERTDAETGIGTSGDFNPVGEWRKLSLQNFGRLELDLVSLDKICGKIVSKLDNNTIKSILCHRWEMKDGAFLDEQQNEIVQRLKVKLGLLKPNEI